MGTLWTELLGSSIEQRYYNVKGVRTRVLEAGQGPCLVLLHGMGGHADVFLRNFSGLSHRFRVVAPDMLGHGFTDKPLDVDYTIPAYVNHLLDLFDTLGVDQPFLSGESMGSWVAAWLAAHHPHRVKKLLLATPGNLTNNPETMAMIRERSLAAVQNPTLESVRQRLLWLFHRVEELTEEIVHIRYRIYTQPGFAAAMERILCLQDPEIRRMYSWDPSWVSKIHCPVLLVWTRQDPTASLEQGERLASWMANCRLTVLEETGKWPQWEQVAKYNQLHEEFFLNS